MNGFDFGHLRQFDVRADDVSDYKIKAIMVNGRSPILLVKPATAANKGYFNARMKTSAANGDRIRAKVKKERGVVQLNADTLDEVRETDRALYPSHVVTGWNDVIDANGEDVEFSAEACSDFLNALPDWVFDDLRVYCENTANFTDVVNVETTAKN